MLFVLLYPAVKGDFSKILLFIFNIKKNLSEGREKYEI